MSGVSSIEIILEANVERELPYGGTFFRCTEADAAFTIKPDNDSTSDIEKGIGVTVQVPFNKLYIRSTVDQTIKIYVGSGGVDDSRFSLINPVANSKTFANHPLVGGAAATLIALGLGTRLVKTFHTDVDMWIGGSTITDADGFPIKAGTYFEWKNTANLYGYSLVACDLRTVEDVKI